MFQRPHLLLLKIIFYKTVVIIKEILFLTEKKIKVKTHCSVSYLHKILGEQFNDYRIIAVARSPMECVISKYFFYKKGRAYTKSILFINKFKILNFLKVMSARLLNFNIWCIFYIFRVNVPYLLIDDKLPKNVTVIDFKQFKNQPEILFNLFPSLSFSSEGFFINNKTKYSISDITIWNLTKHILRFKLRKEISFYNLISTSSFDKK